MSDFIDLKQVTLVAKEPAGPSRHIRDIIKRLGGQEFTKAHISAIVASYPEYEHLRSYRTLDGLIKDTLRRMAEKGQLTKEKRRGELMTYKAILAMQTD